MVVTQGETRFGGLADIAHEINTIFPDTNVSRGTVWQWQNRRRNNNFPVRHEIWVPRYRNRREVGKIMKRYFDVDDVIHWYQQYSETQKVPQS